MTSNSYHSKVIVDKGVISGPASPAMAGPIIRPVRAIFQWLLKVIKTITILMIINYCLNYKIIGY